MSMQISLNNYNKIRRLNSERATDLDYLDFDIEGIICIN